MKKTSGVGFVMASFILCPVRLFYLYGMYLSAPQYISTSLYQAKFSTVKVLGQKLTFYKACSSKCRLEWNKILPNQMDRKYLESFEIWCWKRMEKIKWPEKVTNQHILDCRAQKRTLLNNILCPRWSWGNVLASRSNVRGLHSSNVRGLHSG